jgi:hypothetical protein
MAMDVMGVCTLRAVGLQCAKGVLAHGPELIQYVVTNIPRGREAAIERLRSDLKQADDNVCTRIHQTPTLLIGDEKAKAIPVNATARIRSYWETWNEQVYNPEQKQKDGVPVSC